MRFDRAPIEALCYCIAIVTCGLDDVLIVPPSGHFAIFPDPVDALPLLF